MHGLTIHRWHLQCLVSSELPDQEKVRVQVTDAVLRDVSGWLQTMLASTLPSEDQSLVFIDRLELLADVNAAWERDQIAKRIAVQFATALQRQLSEQSAGIRWFRNRTDYVARFLIDCSTGVAWQQWWYRAFEGLRPLQASSAIRTVLIDPEYPGREALASMLPATAERVVASMTESDASRVGQAWVHQPGQSAGAALQAVLRCWQQAPWAAAMLTSRSLLTRYAAVAHEHPEQAGITLFLALELFNQILLHVEGQVWHVSAPAFQDVLQHILETGVFRQHYASLAQTAIGTETWQETWGVLASTLSVNAKTADPSNGPVRNETLFTPFGGIFLLLPLLPPLEEEDDPVRQRCNSLWQLAMCFGAMQRRVVFADTALRVLFALPAEAVPVDCYSIRHWRETLPAACDAWMDSDVFACVSLPDASMVLLDGRAGYWQCHARHALAPRLDPCLMDWLAALPEAAQLMCEPALLPWLQAHLAGMPYSTIQLVPMQGFDIESAAGSATHHAVLQLRVQQYHADWTFLAGDAHSGQCNGGSIVRANNLLRSLACRLPGFSQSGLEHVVRNFLAMPAGIELRPDCIRVSLGRAPLDLMLSMTGMKRRSVAVPWLDHRPLQLISADE